MEVVKTVTFSRPGDLILRQFDNLLNSDGVSMIYYAIV